MKENQNNSLKTEDILIMFIAFDLISNNKNLPPDMLKPLSGSYENIREFLNKKGMINIKAPEPEEDLTLIQD